MHPERSLNSATFNDFKYLIFLKLSKEVYLFLFKSHFIFSLTIFFSLMYSDSSLSISLDIIEPTVNLASWEIIFFYISVYVCNVSYLIIYQTHPLHCECLRAIGNMEYGSI